MAKQTVTPTDMQLQHFLRYQHQHQKMEALMLSQKSQEFGVLWGLHLQALPGRSPS
jgi:hypothetical protein